MASDRVSFGKYQALQLESGKVRFFHAGKLVARKNVPAKTFTILKDKLKKQSEQKVKANSEQETEQPDTYGSALMKQIGRPSSYDPKYCAMLIDYFKIEKYQHTTVEKQTKYYKDGTKSSETEKLKLIPNDLPTLEGFARSIGIPYRTMYDWAHDLIEVAGSPVPVKKHPEFSQAYNIGKELQKEFLIDNGLKGNYPPAAYIFTAKNITDMADTTVIENGDKGLKEKKDALSDWFDTLRNNATITAGDATADEDTV